MAVGSNLEFVNNVDFSREPLPDTSFEQYKFTNCTFSDLAGIDFIDCIFQDCNISNASVKNCKISDIAFINCKLTGVNFSESKDFAFAAKFENCILDYAIFEQKKLNKSVFNNCRIHGADFTQADMSKCKLNNCDFMDTVFYNTNLAGADFSNSKNFTIDPASNNVKKAKFLASDLAGLLTRFDIIIK
ncbi:pentapeptide repeat-containing protein [Dyadobacter sediminis]|uniref:Pentapeptide repeat-containing protein n=1 Tax=Dyadobacter sediminis TaxID=1493691 RepID=A0A5R9KEM0_9BACT|nr:pentapeptide repeat-containing protein [Dyadobacter sediminis]TLU94481.1 pentapeptide repeat-containing protein [Dyadobacter sediminis]GGB90861.1 quinolone resistance protein [Dyadobacter sediminis]